MDDEDDMRYELDYSEEELRSVNFTLSSCFHLGPVARQGPDNWRWGKAQWMTMTSFVSCRALCVPQHIAGTAFVVEEWFLPLTLLESDFVYFGGQPRRHPISLSWLAGLKVPFSKDVATAHATVLNGD